MPQFMGIDLGTTFTQAAISTKDMFAIDPNELKCDFVRFRGSRPSKFPSLIYIPSPDASDEEWIAGSEADEHRKYSPQQVIVESKSALSQEHAYRRYMHVFFENLKERRKIEAKKATEVILKKAIESMVDVDFAGIEACTITYPASFPDHALEQTMEAAKNTQFLAELYEHNNLHFLPEPIAAFLGYINSQTNKQNFKIGDEILVIDVGAGTTDFTILKIKSLSGSVPEIEIDEVGPHLLLAGNTIDRIIAEYLAEKLFPDTLLKQEFDQLFSQTIAMQFSCFLMLLACEIKEKLDIFEDIETINLIEDFSYFELKPIVDDFFSRMAKEPFYKIELDKKEIELRIRKCLDVPIGLSIKSKLKELALRYESSNKKSLDPDYILVAGGSSALKVLRDYIASYFKITTDSERILYDNCPEHLISKGAAVFSSYSQQEKERLKWPVNDNIYLLVNEENGKSWELIWNRKNIGCDFDDTSYKLESSSNELAGYIDLKFGRGFFDPGSKIDRVKAIFRKRLNLKDVLKKTTPVKLRREFRDNLFLFEVYIPELEQKETVKFEVN
jgi:molecular chaperone DnaK (HSP70)